MVKPQEQHECPHCGATTQGLPEFCPSCGRRLTAVKPPGRFAPLVRVLRWFKPADPLGQNPKGVGEAYKHGPMNHGGDAR
jgi:hypothetical protein